MSAFTWERDLDHQLSEADEQTIRGVWEGLLSSRGMQSMPVNPGWRL